MNDIERDMAHQAAADQAERDRRPAGDPAQDAYRLVARAVRQAPMPALPGNFVDHVAARIRAREQGVSVEEAVVMGLMAVLCLGAAVYLAPVLTPMLGQLNLRLPALPWHWVFATVGGVVMAWAMDWRWSQRRPN